ncbi:MAG: ATP-binding protein, partial [Longimicrobiales bacterium]
MDIHLEVLGTPGLRTPEGAVVDFPVGKPLALLIYLAVEGRPVSRDDLARLLWPASTPARARHSVRQAIWLLRRNLGEEVVEGEESVQASRTTLSSDLAAFHQALSDGDIDAAREYWQGPFLKGLSLSECREWEHWREDQRETLRLRFFVALVEQARGKMGEGKEREALSYLDQAHLLNPHSMDVAVLRIEALLATGRIPAARLALEEAKRTQEDLGGAMGALAELEAGFREIERRPDSVVPERVGESVEFVGRTSELAKLRALWKEVLGGRPRSACILGPTGIGKTRLAEEFLSGVEASGGRVARAKGYRNEQRISRGAVTDLVRQLLSLPGAKGISSGSEAVLRAVLPTLLLRANGHEHGDGEPPRVEEVSAAALADALSDLVEAVGFEVSLVLFLDDWQWADKESRALLGKVMRRVRGLPCLFLLAERTGEPSLRQERAESVIRELGGLQIFLGPLTESELAELMSLLAVFTDAEAGEALVRRIHRVTGGNPLFVGELLRKLGEDGVYQRRGDLWILVVEDVPVELDLPESIQELVRARLERLTPTAAHVAGVLAAEDRSASARLLRRRTGLDDAIFSRAVGELVDREVVRWVGSHDLEFAHDQLREAARLYFRPGQRKPLEGWLGKWPGWVGLGLVGGVAAVALILTGGSNVIDAARTATYPLGEGSLLLVGARSALEYRTPRRESESWAAPASRLPLPSTRFPRVVKGAFRARGGELRWFGNAMPGEATPYALEMLEDGGERLLLRTEGDDGFADIGPGGRQALVVSENLATAFYDYDLMLLDLDNDTSRRIYRARERINFAKWSPNGQRIAAGIRAESDTLALLSPRGDVLDRVAFPEYRAVLGAAWCADNRTVLLHIDSGKGRRGVLFDTSDGSRR